jgi:hypothetical protein
MTSAMRLTIEAVRSIPSARSLTLHGKLPELESRLVQPTLLLIDEFTAAENDLKDWNRRAN